MVPTELVLEEQGSRGGVVKLDPGYDLSEPVFSQLTETRQDNHQDDHYLINNQDLEQELTQAVYSRIGDFRPSTGIPTNNAFYDYVFMATCETAGNQLFRRFKVSEGLYPGNSIAEL